MTTVKEIYQGAEKLLNELISKESDEQGHHLTGKLNDSLTSQISNTSRADIMQGFAVSYAQYVDQGVPASSVSNKQIPFLIEYFIKRGYPVYSHSGLDATKLAFMTLSKWKKEGMSTLASRRFSTTGARQNFVELAFIGGGPKIDEYMGNGFDHIVEEQFQKSKSETV